jgi:hypothetical protein
MKVFFPPVLFSFIVSDHVCILSKCVKVFFPPVLFSFIKDHISTC